MHVRLSETCEENSREKTQCADNDNCRNKWKVEMYVCMIYDY